MDYNKTPAGPEMDAAIAEKVMGWTRPSRNQVGWEVNGTWTGLKHADWSPSTDIKAAWEVEERIKELGLQGDYALDLVYVCQEGRSPSIRVYETMFLHIHATPEQRCRAALKAVDAASTRKTP